MTAKEWAKTDKPMTDGKWLSREKRILSDLAAAEERAEKLERMCEDLNNGCLDYQRRIAALAGDCEALYSTMTDWFEVEDWTDPCKAITELEAHCDAVDKGMVANDALASKLEALWPYLRHTPECAICYRDGDDCTCGLTALMGEKV